MYTVQKYYHLLLKWYYGMGILHSTHLNKNFVLEISIKWGMIQIKLGKR